MQVITCVCCLWSNQQVAVAECIATSLAVLPESPRPKRLREQHLQQKGSSCSGSGCRCVCTRVCEVGHVGLMVLCALWALKTTSLCVMKTQLPKHGSCYNSETQLLEAYTTVLALRREEEARFALTVQHCCMQTSRQAGCEYTAVRAAL